MRRLLQTMAIISLSSLMLTLTACQSLNSDLQKFNQGLASINGAPSSPVSNAWQVSDADALAWLQHNQVTWSAHGRLSHVNWYSFWSQQIHAHTPLAHEGYQYCHQDAWGNPPGANCQTFFQAWSMVSSEESQAWGDKLEGED